MNRRLIDTVLDTANIWLNGLVGMGYLLGARVEMLESENPLTNLMAGIIKLHVYMTPPSPAQEIDFVLEYDASYVTSACRAKRRFESWIRALSISRSTKTLLSMSVWLRQPFLT